MSEFYAQPGGLLNAKKKSGCGIFFNRKKVSLFTRISTLVLFSLFALYSQAQNSVTGISISSSQTGTITYGTVASASYTVILTADGTSPDGSSALSLNWSGITPAGITITPASSVTIPAASPTTTVSLTITSAVNTKAGTYNFTVSCTNNPFTSASASFIVNQRPLVINATGVNKVYDGITAAAVTLSDNRIAGDVFTTNYSSATFSNQNAGSAKTVNVSGISISGTDAVNYTFNTNASTTANITTAPLTILASAQNKTYGTTLSLGATLFTSSGLANGETIGSVTLTSTGSINTAGVASYSIIPTAATGGTFIPANYTISYNASGLLTVAAAPLTITANSQSKTYGATITLGTTLFTSTGLVNSQTIGGVTLTSAGAINTADVGTYSLVPSAPTGGTFTPANYALTYISGILTVGPASLSVTATAQSKIYGVTSALGTTLFTSSGLVNSQTIGSVILSSTGAINTAGAGTYSIIPSAAAGGTLIAANYAITYISGILTVTKASTSVLVTADNNPTCFGSPITFTATITSILSNPTGTVQFFDGGTSLGTSGVSGNAASITTSALAVGSHAAIKAVYSGDPNYTTSTSPLFTQTVNAVPTVVAGADVTSCGGTNAIVMTGASAGGTYSALAWSGGGALGSFSGTGTNPALYTFTPSVPAGTFIATLTVTGSGGCTATPSANRRISWAAAADTWLGVNSTNWSDPANWCGGVPIYSTDVIIPAVGSVPFQPILNVTANCRNIIIYGSLSSGAFDFNLYGNWTNNGSFTPGTGRTFISGFSPQFIGGSAANSFTAITLNNSGGVTITGNISITSNLTFTYGKITTGTSTLILGAGATVTGGTTGKYVFGNLQKVINGNAATTFEVGDASVYAPVIVTFSGGTNTSGTLTVSSTQGDHPNIATSFINPAKSVNRFWTISNSGVTGFSSYAAQFTFVAGDIDAGATTANFTIESYSSSTWAIPTTVTKSTTTTQATNIINFGNFQIGEEITPSSCSATGNTLLPGGDITPCIDASTSKETTAAASMAANQYFTMNVIQGMVYQVYTNNPTSPANALTMSVYNDASPYAPVAFSFINTGNPKTAAVNNVYVSFTASFSGKVRVLINQKFLCGATSPPGIVVFVKVVTGSNTLDNEANAGTDSWIGHIYDNTNSGVLYNVPFANYLGYYTEPETIDEVFGGATNCFNVFSNGLLRANVYSETFSVRYRMNSTRHGLYTVDMASDDGSRLAVDNALIYNNWISQSGANQPTNLISLTGNSTLVFDYFEGNAGNQVHFNNIQLILANVLSSNLNQTLCSGSTGLTVSGDAYGTLPSGLSLSGTGYQWTYSTTLTGTRTNITGATSAAFIPATLSPFDIAGTYYIFRNAVLTGTKNIGESPYTATNESSNYLTLTVTTNPITLQPIAGPSTVCINIGTTFTNSTAGGTWSIINGTGSATITTGGLLTGVAPGDVEIDYTYVTGSCFKVVKKTITIFQVPVAYNVTGNGNYCASATGLFITVSNSETGVNYQVYNGATPIGSAVPGTSGISKTFPIATVSATYTILGTNSTTGCSTAMNGSAAITINPLPAGTLSVNNLTSCAGDTLTFTALPAGYNNYVFKSGATIIASGPSNIFKSASLTNGAVITTIVTDVNGCTATTGPLTITINNRPSGNFTASEASGITNDNIICAGSDVNFNFDNPQPSYTNYQFIINNTITIYNGPNAYYTTTVLADKDSVTLIVTSSNGCTTKFGPIKFTVNPLPVAAGVISGLSTVCQGQNTVVYTVPAITNAMAYNWTVPTGASIVSGATTNSITVSYSTSAVPGNVTVSGNNACGDGASSSIAISVNPLPAPAGTITGTATVCQGQNTVTYMVPAINFATGYNWALPTGATIAAGANTNNITVNYSASAASGNIIVNGINACGNGIASASFPVNINLLPGATGTITGAAAVCVGSNNISYSIAAVANATSYNWNYSGAGATISGATDPVTINFSPAATSGILTAKGVNACGNGIVSANYNITINPLPTGSLAATENSGIVPNDNIICANSAINFIATVANGTNYDFKINGISAQNSSSNLFTTNALTANSAVTVDVTNTNGCVATLNTINVIVNPLPVVTLTGPNPICVGSTGNVYTTESGQSNYVWSITGGTITAGGTNTDNTITVSWTAAGTKTINVNYTNINGCSSATSAGFTNAPSFVPALSGPAAVCLNSTGNLYTSDAGFSNYTWSVVGGSITSGGSATDNTATVTWNAAGVKSIQINYTNSFGCNAGSPTALPVTVNTLPSGVVSGNTSVCQGSAAPITFSGSTGARPYTFTYNINGTGLYTATTAGVSNTITVSAPTTTPGIYNYNLISITDANNCGQPASGIATVTVTAPPAATISYAGSPFCTTASTASVTVTGTAGGNYTALPAGLAINTTNGTITPSASAAGTYTITYTVAPAAGCGVFTTTASVTVTKLPTVSISYAGTPYCKSDVVGKPVSISGTGAYSGGSYAASPAGLAINASTGVITPNTSTAGLYTITYTTPSSGGCGAITASTSVTVTDVPTAAINYPGSPYCSSLATAPVTLTGTGAYASGIYSSTAGLIVDASSGNVNPSASTPGTYLVTYTVPTSGGCAGSIVTGSVTITAAPAVNAGTPVATCSAGGATNITLNATATNYTIVTWTSNGTGIFSNANSLTAATYTPGASDITAGSVILTLNAAGNGNCATVQSTKTLTINANPAAVVIKPDNPIFCLGSISPLSSVKDLVNNFSPAFNSTTNNVAIPDNNFSGITNSISVSGIPANAIINSISVNFNITHPANADLTVNLRAPNNNELNLANSLNGANFTNTVISSAASNPIQTFGTAPYTGTYAPNAVVGALGSAFSSSFTGLYTTATSLNGGWILKVSDNGLGDIGTFNNWSITINYSLPVVAVPVTWAPFTDLYTDAAATIPYSGQTLATIYSKPSSQGIKTYTATSASATGCATSTNVTVTVKPSPVVFITADYCSTPGSVTLTANAPGAVSYNWNTGANTQTILADVARDYYASVTNSDGCVGTNVISIAKELVVNGDFTNGNTGFTSGYTYYPDVAGNSELVNDTGTNGYSVGTSGQNYHPNFYGKDHTNNQTGNKNFMLVNGHGTITVWQETVSVKPNTNYYYSAWGMNLNPASPARLQFEVNGVAIGTIADLNIAAKPVSDAQVDLTNWARFYYGNTNGWNSGSNTTAVIRIVDLNAAASGNDFGLDDISFATLSPFVTGPVVPGTDNQVVCSEKAIDSIGYKVGSGAAGPLVTNLPPGVIYTFDGLNLIISGTPTAPGTYNYTVSTTGSCPNPSAASGTIVVKPSAVITLTSAVATQAQTLCIGSTPDPVTYSITGGGTGATVSGLPAGIFGSYSNGIFTISGLPTQAGTFNYTITTAGTCVQKTAVGTFNISTATVGGSINSPAICIGNSATLTLAGYVGSIIRWEVSTDGGTTWVPIINTTNTYTSTITQPSVFRALVRNNTCADAYSTGGKILLNNYWEGKINNQWSVAANWSSGNLPNMASCSNTIIIPKGINFDPTLTGTGSTINLIILTNGHLIVNGGNLKVAGLITNNGILDATSGGVEYNGATPQSITAGTFLNNAIRDLTISNTDATGVTLGGPVDVYRSLAYGASGKNLNTLGLLTLKSTASETAGLGNMTGHTITGDVTVERYIATGTGAAPNHGKSWQLLAIPTTGETIKQAWQEGATASNITSPAIGSPGNPNTGYGTMITSDLTNAVALGFDGYTQPGPSMKVFNSLTNGYTGPVSTAIPIYNQKGYFVFVRGDRSVYLSGQAADATILRTKGTLFTPANPPGLMTIPANSFESVGNPYASALDMRNITRSPEVNAVFQVWDPRLGGEYNYGAFQTFVRNTLTGDYEVNPGRGSYGLPGTVQNFIQSGQAFIVQTVTGGTVAGSVGFTESAKANGSALFSRPAYVENVQQMLRTDLYNGAGTELIDGVLDQFDDSYSNKVDALDAKKSGNTGENLSIKTAGILLVVERRHTLTAQDTIFLNLTGEKAQPYQFQFTADNINAPGLEGFLEDSYLHTRTPVSLSGSTAVNFTIQNIAGSYARDRFRIVFAPSVVLPVTFTSVKAYQQDKNINVEWRVENENNMKQYEVERSINGTQFTTLVVKAAAANDGRSAIYVTTDITPFVGYNYYRVKSVDVNGKTSYTSIVKVLIENSKQDIVIVPNPITDGMIHLQLLNQPEGKYGLRLLDKLGQVIVSRQINRAEGSSTEFIKWNFNLAHGMYQLEVTKPDGGVKNINVLY